MNFFTLHAGNKRYAACIHRQDCLVQVVQKQHQTSLILRFLDFFVANMLTLASTKESTRNAGLKIDGCSKLMGL